eukprot:UN00570
MQSLRTFTTKAIGSTPSRAASYGRQIVTKHNKKIFPAVALTVGTYTAVSNAPQMTNMLPTNMVAYAGWLPHKDLPPPRTLKEAVHYNDYPPGFTEAIPNYENDPPIGVKKVVAGNLEEFIMNPEKDVFVQFSQEKCSSCQSFARILDSLAFAFRDVPSIQFLEMKGTSNYVPGILTSEEEVLYPTFKFFPAGDAKQYELQRAKEFVKMVREYNLKVLAENDPEAPLPPGMVPTLDKSKFPGCGYSMPMNMGDADLYVWERFVDIIHEQAKIKFDKEHVKQQLSLIEPALKREISHNIRQTLPGYELVGSLAPCGKQWDAFQDAMLRRGVGSSKIQEFHDAMDDVRRCVVEAYPVENSFWKEMMNLSIHMTHTLNTINTAKKQEGLTENDAQSFFKELSQAARKRAERQEKQKNLIHQQFHVQINRKKRKEKDKIIISFIDTIYTKKYLYIF